MWELVRLAKIVNARNSTKTDFKNYVMFKDQMFFTETIYCFGDNDIMNESQIQAKHPLLTKSVTDVIDEDTLLVRNNKVVEKIKSTYPGFIEDRLRDRKPITSIEKLYDKYQIVSKDLDDGVAITAHKSQGSTYNTVFINEADFNKVTDIWDHANDLLERRTKEKNQLLYVAYTRPSSSAHVLYSS